MYRSHRHLSDHIQLLIEKIAPNRCPDKPNIMWESPKVEKRGLPRSTGRRESLSLQFQFLFTSSNVCEGSCQASNSLLSDARLSHLPPISLLCLAGASG